MRELYPVFLAECSEPASSSKWGQLVVLQEAIITSKLKSMNLWQFKMDKNLPLAIEKALKQI